MAKMLQYKISLLVLALVSCLSTIAAFKSNAFTAIKRTSISNRISNKRTSQLYQQSSGGGNKRITHNYDEISRLLGKTSIYLVGMMGSGKSTCAERLSKRIGYQCMDTDDIAEKATNMMVAQLFEKQGEGNFRKMEHIVLAQLEKMQGVVVATGGGIVVKEDNWPLLQHGVVVFLDVSPHDINTRLMKNPTAVQKRPLLVNNPLQSLIQTRAKRLHQYARADLRVPVGVNDTADDTTTAVLDALVGFIHGNSSRWQELSARNIPVISEVSSAPVSAFVQA